jgi:hypothetical protein
VRAITVPGVWEGGGEAYESVLRKEYEAARERLQVRLGQCDQSSERQAVADELKKLRENFEKRLQAIRRSLFGVP